MSTQPPTENIQKNDETQKDNLTIETNDVELTIEDKKNVNLTDVFTNSEVPYIGFIGVSKRKIDFFITSIKRDTVKHCLLQKR